jgi:peroxiredoxin
MEGQKTPAFTLPDLSGKQVSLSRYEGNVVLLDFWATWCAPCRRAHPELQELYKTYKDEGLVILGINNESRQTARKYMQENNYTFPTLLDTTDSVAREYGVSAIPYYFVVDRQGNISSRIVGYHPKSYMLQALKKAGLSTSSAN